MSRRKLRILFAASVAVNLVLGFLLFCEVRRSAALNRPATIESVVFEGGTMADGVIVVEFDAPMPADSWVDASNPPVVLQPPLDFDFAWSDSRTLVLDPREPVSPGRTIVIAPAPELTTAAGGAVSAEPSRVDTADFALIDVVGPVRTDDASVRIGLEFNGPVAPAALREFVRVRVPGKKKDLPVQFTEGEPVRRPEIIVSFPAGTEALELRIDSGLKAAGAERGLSSRIVRQLPLPAGLGIESVEFYRDGDGFRARFDASGKLDWQRIGTHIQVVPAVANLAFHGSGYHSGRYVVSGDFKPRTFYRFTFRRGLPSTTGQVLTEDVHRTAVTGDLGPALHFVTRGPYLPASRDATLPVRVRNVPRVDAVATRVFPNNIPAFLRDGQYSAQRHGFVAGRRAFVSDADENESTTLALPLEDLIADMQTGIYRIQVRDPQTQWRSDSVTVVLTNLAPVVTLTDRQCRVWVSSLDDARPVADCEVRIFSRANQLLGEGVTDAQGLCAVDLARTAPGDEPFCAVVSRGEDVSCVEFDGSRALTEYKDTGRTWPQGAYEAFVYTERGVCRPGETIQINLMVRDRELQAAGGFSAELRIIDPAGRRFATETLRLDDLGFANFAIPIPRNAASGGYQVSVGEPGRDSETPDWGGCRFSVANYIADRIRVDLRTSQNAVKAGDRVSGSVSAAYYFGLPAAGNKVVLRSEMRSRPFVSKAFPEHSFGDSRRSSSSFSRQIEGVTSAAGVYEFDLDLPGRLSAASSLELVLSATVQDPGGRGVADVARIDVRPYPWQVGLRKRWDGAVPDSGATEVEWVAVDVENDQLRPEPGDLTCSLEHITWDYVLTEDSNGNYHWTWTRHSLTVTDQAAVRGTGEGRGTIKLPESLPPGEYRLTVDAEGRGGGASIQFWLYHGTTEVRPTHASAFPLTPDRDVYEPGATARLTFDCPSAGQGLLVVGDRQVRTTRMFNVAAGENALEFTVPETVSGSVYAAVTVVRDDADGLKLPRRLFGFRQVGVDQAAHRVRVELDCVDQARPETVMPLTVRLRDAAGAPVAGRVQVMAVDEGILALTGFQTPAPFEFFFGARRCPWRFFDVWDAVFPEIDARGTMRSADAGGGMTPLLNPVEVELSRPAIVLLPVADVPETGELRLELPVPDHVGALRIMAVALSPERVGHAERELVVRDPVSALLSGPRAVAPGDEFDVTVNVFNNDVEPDALVELWVAGEGQCMLVAADTAGAGADPQRMMASTIAKGASRTVRIPVKATDAIGAARVVVDLRWNGENRSVRLPLAVRPPRPPISFANFAKIEPGTELRLKAGGGWIEGTGRVNVTVAGNPLAEVMPTLEWLQRYPYGCLEQTVSAAFPALVLDRVARAHGVSLHENDDTTEHVAEEALRRVLLMELPGGGFSMWPGGSRCWIDGSVYTLHFCAEAEELGMSLDPVFRKRSVDFLRRLVVGDGRLGREASLDERAYAGYVLARFGEPNAGLAGGLMEHPDASPLARILAATAVQLAGGSTPDVDVEAARKALDGTCAWGMDSRVRRAGLMLDAMLQLDPDSDVVDYLVPELRRERSGRGGGWGTTQNNAVALVALAKWMGYEGVRVDSSGRIEMDSGERFGVDPGETVRIEDRELPMALTVVAEGPGPLFVAWDEHGVPTSEAAARLGPRQHGIKVRRGYFDEDGRETTTFEQGDLVRVRIEMEPDATVRDAVVVDLLPGGLEIEDASLKTRVARHDQSRRVHVKFTDRRDDRFLLFADVHADHDGPAMYEYTARAVTPGEYLIPGIGVEAMYDADVQALQPGGGRLIVRAAE